jgi:hypothetical protein
LAGQRFESATLAIGLAISAAAGLCLGIAAGVLPLFGAPLSPLLTVLSMVPPLAILPILFIVFGLGELSKVMLIVIGITPVLARDLEQRAREIPVELLIKAQTFGRLDMDLDAAGGAAAIAAAPADLAAAGARLGVAVPDRGRSHRLHRRPRLPDLSWCAAIWRWT